MAAGHSLDVARFCDFMSEKAYEKDKVYCSEFPFIFLLF
jgi:hypothetical protein